MYLKTIQVISETDNSIRVKCFFLTRLYEEYLHKFYLDNSDTLTIIITNDSISQYEHDEYEKISFYRLSKDLSTKIILADENNISEVLNLIIYNVINEIIDLVQKGNDRILSKDMLSKVFSLIQINNYEYCKTITKLSRISNCNKYKSIVYMRISQSNGEQWEVKILDRHSNTVFISDIINKYGSYIDRRDMYHHSIWIDNIFYIYNRLERVVYHIQVS